MKISSLKDDISARIPRDYPYINARVSAKGGNLLERNDYEALLKMQANGIARKLEEGQYSREINELGSKLDGTELVERALEKNASRTLRDLIDMSPPSLEKVLKIYFRRYDIESLKNLLRTKNQAEEYRETTSPGFDYSEDELKKLFEKEFGEIIESIEFEGPVDYSKYLDSEMSLEEFECAIDQAYFDELEQLADMTGNDKLKEFIEKELEYENLRVVLRLKKYDVDPEEIRDRCFNADSSKLIQACTDAEDLNKCIQLLKNSRWNTGNSDALEEIEQQLKVSRLRESLKTLKTDTLGLAPVMAFAVAKMVEVENLRIMVQAKSTGAQKTDEIRKNLVIS